MKDMKWHIVDGDNYPLCWDYDGWESERAIEFDSELEAIGFLKIIRHKYPDFKIYDAQIIKSILYYDGGYVSGAEAKRLMVEELNEKVV